MAHSPGGPNGPVGPVVQKVQISALGDVVPPVAVGGGSGGVVGHGVQGSAVDHAIGVPALGANLQTVDGQVRFQGLQTDEIMVCKRVGA